MRSMRPDKDVRVTKLRIPTGCGSISALLLSPAVKTENVAGVLWLHGGGYAVGMKEMVHMSRAVELVKLTGIEPLPPVNAPFRRFSSFSL